MSNEAGELVPHLSPQVEPHVQRQRRIWTRSALIGSGFALIVHVWMLSAGTWNLFRWTRQSDLYDAQARSFLEGTFAMDPRVLGIESFARGDQSFMYFGPVPALLRLPVVAVTRNLDGRLAAVSMLVALLVIIWALLGLGWRLRERVLDGVPTASADAALAPDPTPAPAVSRVESIAVAATFFAIVGGSSLLYASSRTWVYHEAILWGVGLTLASLASLLAWLDTDPLQAPGVARRHLVSASILAALALLTRPSVGGAAIAAIGIVGARQILLPLAAAARDRERSVVDVARSQWRETSVFVGVTGLPVVAYCIVNWVKFRRLFGVPFDQQGFTLLNERRREMLAANGGTLFNADFIPTNLFTYLRPDLVELRGGFPYLQPERPAVTIGSPFFDLIDFTAGIPSTMPLLLVLAVVGVVAVARRSNGNVRSVWPLLAGCTLGTIAVLAIGYLANRYQSDFLPLLIVAALIGLPVGVRWLEAKSDRKWLVGGAVTTAVLIVAGTVTNLAFGYSYQRVFSPSVHPDSVAGYVANQLRADQWFGDGELSGVIRVSELPAESDVGDIAIVGECDGLYVSDGVVSVDGSRTHWRLAELSARAGHARGTFALPNEVGPATPLVQLASGSGTATASTITVSVEVDEARGVMAVVAQGAGEATRGPDLPLRIGKPLDWETFADPFVGKYEVFVDGRLAVLGTLPTGQDAQITLGENVDSLPIDVDRCEAVLAGLGSHGGNG